MIKPGELIQLVNPKGKRYLRILDPDFILHTHDGHLNFSNICQADFGQTIKTHIGKEYRILKPTLYDILKNIERKTQIIYPKDIGYILLKLGIKPGSKVIEAGSGSGSLTIALAWFVGTEGKVFTFERKQQFQELCAKNLSMIGLQDRVHHSIQDITEGFGLEEIDAIFLDIRTPWDYLSQVLYSIQDGAPVGFLLPTMNQVSTLLHHLEQSSFLDLEIIEIFLRHYKPVSERLRPEDRMIAHTGYLIFARAHKKK